MRNYDTPSVRGRLQTSPAPHNEATGKVVDPAWVARRRDRIAAHAARVQAEMRRLAAAGAYRTDGRG